MSQKKRILLIEDEEDIAALIKLQAEISGYKLHVEVDGINGFRAVEREKPDLVVLDLMLPGMNGYDLCRKIKATSELRHIPIIILSAKNEELDVLLGLELGADDYVTKPFGLEELLLRVGAILRRTKAAVVENSVLRCGALALDEDQHKVFYADAEIELSPTEFKLLQELMRNKGRVLTKSALLRDVWEIDFETETSVLDTYISYLRKKLNRDGLEFIRTVRGVGYQIVEPA